MYLEPLSDNSRGRYLTVVESRGRQGPLRRVGHVARLHRLTQLPANDIPGVIVEHGRETEPAPAFARTASVKSCFGWGIAVRWASRLLDDWTYLATGSTGNKPIVVRDNLLRLGFGYFNSPSNRLETFKQFDQQIVGPCDHDVLEGQLLSNFISKLVAAVGHAFYETV